MSAGPTVSMLLDLTHTSHSRARSGIQRVTRSLHRTLRDQVVAITHDPHLGAWRQLEPWEEANLSGDAAGASKRGAHWPWRAKLRGHTRRLLALAPRASRLAPSLAGLLVPEIFSAEVAAALP